MVQLSRLQTFKNWRRLKERSTCLRRCRFSFAVDVNAVACETLAGYSATPHRIGARRSASIPLASRVSAASARRVEPDKDRPRSKHRQPVATPSRQRQQQQRRRRRSVGRELEQLPELSLAGIRLRRHRKARRRMHNCSVQDRGRGLQR